MSTVYDCDRPDQRTAGLAAAAGALRSSRLVVFPTDTVYGIGCDAFDATGVSALFEAKGRGRDMPLSVLVGSWDTVHGLVRAVPRPAQDLIEAFWPGGLSIVLPQASSLAWDLGDTRGTVSVRMPLHPVALEMLREVGPIAQSSANRSGHPPAATVAEATDQLADTVEVYLDGGPAGDAVPSTIVDLTSGTPRLLREGAVTRDAVAEVVGVSVGLA
ncbi:MAG TPA: L-threonylcarbamoyladenylate synthase [Pseudonocardiaceae bacterium]|nr:L-threonylcarbamoyladenylate synthase [Pseudonocardiaceae bacterium]